MVIAVAHIVSVLRIGEKVRLELVGDESVYTFEGDNAKALWDWASAMLRCSHITD